MKRGAPVHSVGDTQARQGYAESIREQLRLVVVFAPPEGGVRLS